MRFAPPSERMVAPVSFSGTDQALTPRRLRRVRQPAAGSQATSGFWPRLHGSAYAAPHRVGPAAGRSASAAADARGSASCATRETAARRETPKSPATMEKRVPEGLSIPQPARWRQPSSCRRRRRNRACGRRQRPADPLRARPGGSSSRPRRANRPIDAQCPSFRGS